MTRCNGIQTSSWVAAPCPDQYENRVAPPPNRVNLFSPISSKDELFSRNINVEPGTAVLIEAYNMPEDQAIYINRVVPTNYEPPSASACPPKNLCLVPGPDGFNLFTERMRMGNSGDWRLYKSANPTGEVCLQMLITIPGSYNLELSTTDMLGLLEVDYMKWNLNLTPYMPMLYHAGISDDI